MKHYYLSKKKTNWMFLSHNFLLLKLLKMGMIIPFLSNCFPPPKWAVNVNFYFLVYHQCGQRCHTTWLLKVMTLTLWLSFNLSLVFDRKVWRQRLKFLRPLMKKSENTVIWHYFPVHMLEQGMFLRYSFKGNFIIPFVNFYSPLRWALAQMAFPQNGWSFRLWVHNNWACVNYEYLFFW